jgi:hypothetical protein
VTGLISRTKRKTCIFNLDWWLRHPLDDPYPSSVRGSARKPFEDGKLFDVRETTPPAVTRDLPIRATDEIQIHRVTEIWELRPFRFKQFRPSAGVHDEIHFAGSISPEEEAASARRGVRDPAAGRRRTSAKLRLPRAIAEAPSDRMFRRAQSRPVSAI